MILHDTRYQFTDTDTMSRLDVDMEDGRGALPAFRVVGDPDRGLHLCDSLESIKARKVQGRTCIPAGFYRVTLEHSGKYGPDTPTISGVPGFRYIRIHAGNDEDDTEGCILAGLTWDDETGEVYQSSKATKWLRDTIQREIRAGRAVWYLVEREPHSWAARLAQMEAP